MHLKAFSKKKTQLKNLIQNVSETPPRFFSKAEFVLKCPELIFEYKNQTKIFRQHFQELFRR